MLLSIGVCIAAVVIYIWPVDKYPWSKYADPFCTLVFSVLVCLSCKPILSNCIFILMEGAPEVVDTEHLIKDLKKLQEKVEVHDFHVWSLSKGKYSLSCHIQCDGEPMKVLKQATQLVNDYGIDHCTI